MKPIVLTFLQQLYRQDKKLLLVLLLYGCGILYCLRWQREEFPFLLYGMYSLKEEPKQAYITYALEIDSQQISLDNLSDSKRELITAATANAAELYDAGKLSKEQQEELVVWIYSLCSAPYTWQGYERLSIYRLSCAYNEVGKPVTVKKELLFNEE